MCSREQYLENDSSDEDDQGGNAADFELCGQRNGFGAPGRLEPLQHHDEEHAEHAQEQNGHESLKPRVAASTGPREHAHQQVAQSQNPGHGTPSQ